MADQYLLSMKQHYLDSAKLFSNKGTKARELLSVALFLDLAGVDFDASQLRPSRSDPPDVIFQASQEQCCNFEVVERLDPDTKRHGPYRDAVQEISKYITQGKSAGDYIREHTIKLGTRRSISLEDLICFIEDKAEEKHTKYINRKNMI